MRFFDRVGQPYSGLRLRIVLGCCGLCFGVILVRLLFLQVFMHTYFKALAGRQHQTAITLHPERGRIFDRYGQVLATSVPVPSVAAFPEQIVDHDMTARQLAQVLGKSEPFLARRLRSTASFVWLQRHILPEQAAALRAQQLPGVEVIMETRRFYPKRHLAGQVLGFVGVDEQGLGGLEYLYDDELSGQARQIVRQHDARGRKILQIGSEPVESPRGADLYLTIDERLQYVAEKELALQVEHTRAKSGIVVMMDPLSGDILALASYPFFNPNDYQNPAQRAWQRNRAVTDPVEPGSTFKVVAAAAALQERTAEPYETFFCERGLLVRGKRRLRDHHPYGYLTFSETIEYSSNICMVKINERLSDDTFYDYIRRFGFGSKTLIDLPGEETGQIRPPQQWSALSHDSLTLGQEITVTPIQLATAYAAIANGGWLMRPRVVSRLIQGTEEHVFAPQVRPRVILRETAQRLTTMLTGAVLHGTGKQAALSDYLVAGKTGTAQKAIPQGGYSRRKLLVSFVGYVPAGEPKLVVLVMIDEPAIDKWGGAAAAPVFQRIARQALHYLQIPPPQAQLTTFEESVGQTLKLPTTEYATPQMKLSSLRQ